MTMDDTFSDVYLMLNTDNFCRVLYWPRFEQPVTVTMFQSTGDVSGSFEFVRNDVKQFKEKLMRDRKV